ncbi:MAG: hypothetical protein SOY42_07325 [Clostridium sp.]|nr:hypothetical protein [Clostridium sp.]
MEMCYDGALVMPSNCVKINQEEMMYLEGGDWAWSTFKKNIIALNGMYTVVKVCAKASGVWQYITSTIALKLSVAKAKMAAFIVDLGIKISTVSRVLGAAAIVGGAAAVAYLGNKRVFY